MSTPHVVLVGLMGVGKTTIGRRLAKAMDRPFLDSDAVIVARTGRSVREIFEADGEPAFRAVEREVLAEALASPEPAVIAAAGGTVLDASSRQAMRDHGFVIWLQAEPAVLARRTASGQHRPLLDEGAEEALARMARDRTELYAEVADVVVDVGPVSMDDAARQVVDLVMERAS